MLVRSITVVALVAIALVWCGSFEQQFAGGSPQHQEASTATATGAWGLGAASQQEQASRLPAAAAYSTLLQGSLSVARSLLGIEQRPNATASPSPSPKGIGDGSISDISAQEPPQIPPTILNASAPQRPAPAPAATSAAAGEAASDASWTGPTVKSVSEVKAGDSCVCWTADWCTCGWQSCPYQPPNSAASLSEAAQTLFGPDVLPQMQLGNDAPASRTAPPLTMSMLRRFNKRISTQLINPLYQFTTEHYLIEGAREVIAAGSDSFKFNLANLDARGRAISNVKTPLDMVRSPSLPYAEVFDMPITMYFMWVFPDYSKPYQETYELATYLLRKYQGTGKQFFIGMWEGDHALRKPGNWGQHVPPDVDRMETLQFVIQQKQKAVDDAKRDNPGCRNVYLWNYIEANFVLPSIWNRNKISVINWLVPTIDDPPVDYISYSAYEVLFSGDWKLTNLTAAFDYMAQRLPDKPGIPGPRVFLGEWAFPLYDPQGNPAWTLEETREKGLYAAAVAIAWGSQFNKYWQLYGNHRLANGTGDRGFKLILANRQEAPIWTNMKDYFAASDEFLKRFWACYGGWPSDYTYRVWAVKTLMKLVNNATKPEPPVRDLSGTSANLQAWVVADNTFGELGPTITFRMSGEAPAQAAAQSSRYIPIMGAVKLGDTSGRAVDKGDRGNRQTTPPLVPQFLPPGGGDRGSCAIPLPMIAAGTPRPPSPSPAPGNATNQNSTAPANGTRPGGGAASNNATNTTAPAGNGTRPGAAGNSTTTANATSAGGAAGGATNTSRPGGLPGTNSTGPPSLQGNGTTGPPSLQGNGTSSNASALPHGASRLMGFNSASRTQEEAGQALRTSGGKTQQCEAWDKVTDRLQLKKEECPYNYPRLSVEDVASGKAKPYAYGGIDRIGCANCQQKGLWPRFCLWRRTELPIWDSISCNQRESTGRSSVQRNLELAVNISRHWPLSSGISVPPQQQNLPPGPAEITPCDVFRLIRGRTLWIVGDSQMKGLYTALKCFMLEFWDLQQYSPTWNTTTIDYLNKLPRNAEAKCIHLPESTRICQLKVLWADTFAEKPSKGETRWSTPVLEVLLQHLADPADIIAMNFGLWYDPKNPRRYYNNMISLGQAYQAAKATFPNMFFVETVKLHWPDPPGDQDGPRTIAEAGGMEQCKPTENIVFDARTSQLQKVTFIDPAAASTAASQLLGMKIPEYQMDGSNTSGGGSSSSSEGDSTHNNSRHRRKLLGLIHAMHSQHYGGGGDGNRGSSSFLRSHSSLGPWLAWYRSVQGLLQGRTTRSLLQQQQQQQPPVGTNRTGSQGPLEDSPTFPVLQPAYAAMQKQQPQQGQSPPQLPQTRSASSSTPVLTAAAAAASSSSSDNKTNSTQPQAGSDAPQFPVLQPAFAANSTRNSSGNNGSAQPLTSPHAAAAELANMSRTNSSTNQNTPARTAAESTAGAPAAAAPPASRPVLAPGFGSVMLPPELAAEAVLSGLWRNQIARAVLRDRFGMGWVPIYNATVPAYWGHRHSPDAPDCIHYCNPGAPQNWMAKLMLAIATRVKPLEGEVADKRCLWGTEIVYDEGEKGFQ